ncbi:hypothetical protein [Nostoc sp.]|uniref:hypothetical protein n=1 Tax=Nostoc sp. TaxID=1180 RepID=UPI002FFD4C06
MAEYTKGDRLSICHTQKCDCLVVDYYCFILSVIETCHLRKIDPWNYIAQVLTQGRQGIKYSPIPLVC